MRWIICVFSILFFWGGTRAATTLLGGRGVQEARCARFDRGDYILVTPSCQVADLPELEPHRMMDYLLPLVDHIEGMYDTGAMIFTADVATIQFVIDPWQTVDLIEHSALPLQKLPTRRLAMEQFKERNVYATLRDTTTYGTCRKQNYSLALKALDREELLPGEKLNMNRDISKRRGRCQNDQESYLFGEGACGASTQFFRTAMMTPDLYVTKRYPHGEWRAGFYGDTIRGDDASMYQMNKQLEIQNIGDKSIYLRVREQPDGNKVLLSFFKGPVDQQKIITKAQTGPKSAELSVTTLSLAGEVITEQSWKSNYRRINQETDTVASSAL